MAKTNKQRLLNVVNKRKPLVKELMKLDFERTKLNRQIRQVQKDLNQLDRYLIED